MQNKQPQKNTDATWEWIKHRLGLQGLTFGDLGRMHGKTRSAFLRVKYTPIPKNERIIADLVGVEPWDLWPDRYDENHRPCRISIKYRRAEFEAKHSRWKSKRSMDISGGGNSHETQD